MDVEDWLNALGLAQYTDAFRNNDIDHDLLADLTAEDLKELGIASLGHRKKLLAAIETLGSASPMAVQTVPADRRQVTIFFADLSGYTELATTLDAEELHELTGRVLHSIDEIVVSHGGTVHRHVGDEVMALFGAPVTHGDDPLRAVQAALAAHAAMDDLSEVSKRPLKIHVGIASGEVVVAGQLDISPDDIPDYAVTGIAANLASRLNGLASPGETVISDDVRDQVAPRIECAEMGEVAVKGVATPVRAWRATAIKEGHDTDAHSSFVGRRAETAQISAILREVVTAGVGSAVLLRGEAGIGKSRLVEEIQGLARSFEFDCHRAALVDFGTGATRDTLQTLVSGLLGIDAVSDTAARESAASRVVEDGTVEANQQVFLNEFLDLPNPPTLQAVHDAMDNATRQRGRRDIASRLVEHLSRIRPLFIVVEDIHWADRITLEHLASITPTVGSTAAVLLMTTRIDGDPIDAGWRETARNAPLATIDLGPLRPEEASALARDLPDLDPEFVRGCLERAAGSPFYLEQLLRREDAELPASIQSLILSKVDRLGAEDKQAVQAAAVIGQEFSAEQLRHVLNAPKYDCAELLGRQLVRTSEDGYSFAHALIRDGVYGALLREQRRNLHASAADWYRDREVVLLAEHLDRAEDPEAADAYRRAADTLNDAFEFERAIPLVERGIELSAGTPEVFHLTCLKGQLLQDMGDIQGSIGVYEEALTLAPDESDRFRARLGLAAAMRVVDRYEDAFDILDQAESGADKTEMTLELAQLHHLRGNIFFPLGDLDGCREQHELALDYARAAKSAVFEAQALGGLGDTNYASGKMITAHGYFDDCIILAREARLARVAAANIYMRGTTNLYRNELDAALEDTIAARKMAAAIGHQRAEMVASGIMSYILFDQADLEGSRDAAQCSIDIARQLGARRFEAENMRHLGRVMTEQGGGPAAMTLLEEAFEISRETNITFAGPWILGAMALAARDPVRRREILEEGDRLLDLGCVSHNYLHFYVDGMDAALQGGDWETALRFADKLKDYTATEPLPWSDYFIRRGRALAAHGQGRRDDDKVEVLRDLHDEGERIGMRIALPALAEALDDY